MKMPTRIQFSHTDALKTALMVVPYAWRCIKCEGVLAAMLKPFYFATTLPVQWNCGRTVYRAMRAGLRVTLTRKPGDPTVKLSVGEV